MEATLIKTKLQEMSKIEIAGYGLIGVGILDFLLSWFGLDVTGFSYSPVILGSLGGVFIWQALHNAKAAALVASFESALGEGETLLKSGQVGMQEGMTKVEQGVLLLTNRKLFYSSIEKADASDYEDPTMEEADGKNDFQLLLGEILSVETSFKNLTIKDLKLNEYKLQSNEKKKWEQEILQARKK